MFNPIYSIPISIFITFPIILIPWSLLIIFSSIIFITFSFSLFIISIIVSFFLIRLSCSNLGNVCYMLFMFICVVASMLDCTRLVTLSGLCILCLLFWREAIFVMRLFRFPLLCTEISSCRPNTLLRDSWFFPVFFFQAHTKPKSYSAQYTY